MEEPMIVTEMVGKVLVLRLNRPARLNAAPPALFDRLRELLIAHVDKARAVLITGNERAFCSGADLSSRGERSPSDTFLALSHHFNPTMALMLDYPLPIVAAVNGPAAGIGCSLALAADLVIAGESAYFLQAFVNIGLVPDGGATWILPHLIGKARALEMMMLGERVHGPKAEQWGLIHKSVPDAEVFDTALALASRLANGPTQALGLIRRNVAHALQDGRFADTLTAEAQAQHQVSQSNDAREGTLAFLEKRKPQFTGA